jgi:cell division transport system ATP-binding protein
MQTFLQFNDLGATILIASHDQPLVERMGKRIVELQKVKGR